MDFPQGMLRLSAPLHTQLAQVRFWHIADFSRSLIRSGTEPIVFEGRTDGTIVPTRGPPTFGWDAVFEPLGTGLT